MVEGKRLRGPRIILAVAALLLAASAPASIAVSAGERLPEVARREEQVGPGVTHIQEFHSSGPLAINILRVDLATTCIELTAANGKGTLFSGASVSDMARRLNRPNHLVVGAVNADFWKNSSRLFIPVNLFVSEGMTHTLPSLRRPRAVFAVTESGKIIMKPMTARLEVSEGTRHISCKLNDPGTSSGAVLFTPIVSERISTKRYSAAFVLEQLTPELIPNRPAKARVARVVDQTSVTLTSGTLLLAVHRDQRAFARRLKPGAELTLHIRVPEANEPLRLCLGGGPMLVKNGRVYVDWKEEKILQSFSADRHPRTAIGLGEDGHTLYLVTVDGRQPLRSIGMGLYELALFMKELGCRDAMNFDGGGSTTMVVRGEVVNKPSDRLGPRSVANALLVVARTQAGHLAQLRILPSDSPLLVPTGAKVHLLARGFDEDFNPLPLHADKLTWTVEGALQLLETSSTQCTVRANTSAGEGVVRASVPTSTTAQGNVTASRLIRVLPVSELEIEPDSIVLRTGECMPLTVRALSDFGEIPLKPEMVEIKMSDSGASASLGQVCGMTTSAGYLAVGVGAVKREIPYFVNVSQTRMLESFDSPLTGTLFGTRFDKKKSSIMCDRMRAKEGFGCLAWRYAMTRGGITKIVLPLNLSIPGRPSRLVLSIYGDGKEAWLRGEIEDAVGNRFMLDFTNGSKGVYWDKMWREVSAPLHKLVPRPQNPAAKPKFPIVLREIYLAQDQEALKAQGELLLDELRGEYAPSSAK